MSSHTAQRPGAFIVFEGGDGSGKSTQARLLAEHLGAYLTREPGGTEISEAIRSVVLDPAHAGLTARTEALLMAAARAQHVDEVIVPTLASGRHVVSDRFVGSSLAYQGVGRGLGVDAIAELNRFATAGLEPDLTIVLDVGTGVARDRLGDDLDRIEAAGVDMARQVNQAYRDLAARHPESWVVVAATGSIEGTQAEIRDLVEARLGV